MIHHWVSVPDENGNLYWATPEKDVSECHCYMSTSIMKPLREGEKARSVCPMTFTDTISLLVEFDTRYYEELYGGGYVINLADRKILRSSRPNAILTEDRIYSDAPHGEAEAMDFITLIRDGDLWVLEIRVYQTGDTWQDYAFTIKNRKGMSMPSTGQFKFVTTQPHGTLNVGDIRATVQ